MPSTSTSRAAAPATAPVPASNEERRSLLRVSDLWVRLADHDVLQGVSLEITPGEIVGVIGETGSGKTTLARTIVGLTSSSRGSIAFDGRELTRLRERRRRAFRRSGELQFVFQDPLRALDPALTAQASITEGLSMAGRLDAGSRRREAERVMQLVGLEPVLLDRIPADISGGQRQRVAIARALVTRPRLIVLDEPVSALDASTRGMVLAMLSGLRRELGISLMIISHDLPSMLGVVDRVVVLHEGVIVEEGPTEQLLAHPQEEYTRLLIAAAPLAVRKRLERLSEPVEI